MQINFADAFGVTQKPSVPRFFWLAAGMTKERRRSPRHSLDLTVHVEVPLLCSLSDVSQTGARLTLDDPSLLPDQFALDMDPRVRRWCRVLWRTETQAGVQFTDEPKTGLST
jgi:hypothetical protein